MLAAAALGSQRRQPGHRHRAGLAGWRRAGLRLEAAGSPGRAVDGTGRGTAADALGLRLSPLASSGGNGFRRWLRVL